ncbi:MAG: 2-succinyl-6-hydroxy-2,4-cyclohexadiene-1-carboxylate synthase [Deltaproteobacteria bacterium]|nr:2-succinyl-6-hydroxy-2,4-cyclohexadiene-1-carboxylate synthase [Deltaproteobacteria bacterium]
MKEHFIDVDVDVVDGDVDLDRVRLRAIEEGRGEPVLVLHGFSGDAESMASVADGLRDRCRVFRLELLGHGGSDAPAQAAAYSMAACVAQIRAAARALELTRPHLVGYSMGGRAALAAAVSAPGDFSSLVLVGATAGIADAGLRAQRIRADRALADRIEAGGVELFVDEWMALPLFASQARLGAGALARARAQRLRNSARGLAGSLRGMGAGAQRPLHELLATLVLPTLLVVGEEDEKFKGIAADLASRLSVAQIAVLPQAGHAAHLEAPDEFRRVVCRFLGEHPIGRPARDSDFERERVASSKGRR